MSDAIYNVSATGLFYDRPEPEIGGLLTELNTLLSDHPGCHLEVSPLSHNDWWLFTCEHFHVMVSFADQPSQDPAIKAAALSPITSLRRFDYPQVVQSHRAHVGIEVGDGHAPLPPEARVIMQEFSETKLCDPVLKMQALYWSSRYITRHQGFMALHFAPSDRLLCPEELQEAEQCGGVADVLRHVVPSLPVSGPEGRDGYALSLRNPSHLSGPVIELEGIPVSVPLATSIMLLDKLTSAAARGKISLEHGAQVKPNDKITLFVRTEPGSEDAPQGRVVMSFWPMPAQTKAARAPEPDLHDLPDTPAPKVPASKAITKAAKQAAATLARQPIDELADTLRPKSYGAQTEGLDAEDIPVSTKLPDGMPTSWLRRRLQAVSADMRIKVASLTLAVGLPLIWNPYAGFSGGMEAHSVPNLHQAEAQFSVEEIPSLQLAALTE